MTVNLTAYRIASAEKPASASKQNNMLTALENAFNAFPASQLVGYPSDATKYLNGSGNWVVPPLPPGVATIYAKTTTTDVVNTVTKTDLFGGAFTIAANLMGATGCVKIAAGGDYLNNSGSATTIILELKLGATVLWASAASEPVNSVAGVRHAWHLSAVVQAMGSTSAQMTSGDFSLGPAIVATTGVGIPGDPNYGVGRMLLAAFLAAASTVNMTAAQTLAFSVTHSAANANLSMRCQYARLEVIG